MYIYRDADLRRPASASRASTRCSARSRPGFTADIDAGIGFDAITVALLGRSTPWGTFAAGILFGAFKAGGFAMQAAEGVPIEIVTRRAVAHRAVHRGAAARAHDLLPALPERDQRRREKAREKQLKAEAGGGAEMTRHREHARRSPPTTPVDTTVVRSWKAPIALAIFTVLLAPAAGPRARASGETTLPALDPGRRRSSCPRSPSRPCRHAGSCFGLLVAADGRLRRARRASSSAHAALAHRRVHRRSSFVGFLTWAAAGASIPVAGLLAGVARASPSRSSTARSAA